ncbi:MAG: helix-turn-helix transcriptional regulator [Candidatus Nomurabacteria bacterium]|nr:MAG: helix-turn-helix transcriptional regulator [Candidatus Nomurabacteria bacterium]
MKQSNKDTSRRFEKLGEKVFAKRAGRGVRVVAKDIGISPATLSRIERGYMADIDTFQKVCAWLEIDAGAFLQGETREATKHEAPMAAIHFRKNKEVKPTTAKALAEVIIAAQKEMAKLQPIGSE